MSQHEYSSEEQKFWYNYFIEGKQEKPTECSKNLIFDLKNILLSPHITLGKNFCSSDIWCKIKYFIEEIFDKRRSVIKLDNHKDQKRYAGAWGVIAVSSGKDNFKEAKKIIEFFCCEINFSSFLLQHEGCVIYLMSDNSIKNSNKSELFLYKSEKELFFYIKEEKKTLDIVLLEGVEFESTSEKLIAYNDKTKCDEVLKKTSRLGFTNHETEDGLLEFYFIKLVEVCQYNDNLYIVLDIFYKTFCGFDRNQMRYENFYNVIFIGKFLKSEKITFDEKLKNTLGYKLLNSFINPAEV